MIFEKENAATLVVLYARAALSFRPTICRRIDAGQDVTCNLRFASLRRLRDCSVAAAGAQQLADTCREQQGQAQANALFRLPPRPDGLGHAGAVRRLRGRLAAELHARLHRRRVRRRRYRLDQDRLPLRHRFRPGAVHRPEGPGLHHGGGLERRDAGRQVGVQAQHPPLEPLALHRRGEGLPRPGDTITIRFGDRRQGSPGIRLQTYCEREFEFRVFADPIATYDYVALPESPKIAIVPGPGVRWRAVLPTLVRAGEPFRLCDQGRRQVGQSLQPASTARCGWRATAPVAGLPGRLRFAPGGFAAVAEGLCVAEPGDCVIRVLDEAGSELCRSNPLRVARQGCAAGAFLGRHARSVERDARHQYGARVLRVRPRQGLPRRDGPPGQRLPDHRRVLARAERAVGRVRQARPLRVHSGLRVVGQHGGGRRPQRALPARGRDHPPLLACADRGRGRHRRRGTDAHDAHALFAKLAGQGLRGDGPRRRALCRHQVRARPDGNGGRGAFGLGHLRVDRARRLREGLPRRHRRQLGRAQGPARRLLSRRLVLRQLRRAHLLPGRAARPRCDLRMHAPAAALRHDGQPCAARRDGRDGRRRRGVRARSCGRADHARSARGGC